MSRIYFLLLLFVSIGCNTKQQPEQHAPSELDSLLSTLPDFSGVVVIADSGKCVYSKAQGFLDFNQKNSLDSTAVFELASISKTFTAMVIMMLKEEGKLSYDDPMEKYLPGLPYPGITIRQLLNHTSGLPDYQALMDEQWDKTKVAGNDDIIEYLKKFHPVKNFEPGTKYEYSNTGYVLLATIAEKASGEDFISFCRERIFKPLNMTSSDIRTRAEKINLANMAWGHIWLKDENRYERADSFPSSNYTIWLGNRKGPGRISSTATDLLKWDAALLADKLVKPETLKEAFQPAKLLSDSLSNYGLGWMLRERPETGKVVYHDGDNPGYSTIFIRYLDKKKTIIALCNNKHQVFTNLIQKIEQIILKK